MKKTSKKFRVFFRNSQLALFVGLCIAFLTVGCSTINENAIKRIEAFSKAAELTSKNTSDAFDLVNRRHFDLRVARIVAEGGWEQLDSKAIMPFLSPGEVQARKTALNGLEKYAETLSAIMGNEQLDYLDKTTKDLSDSLIKIDAEFVKAKLIKDSAVSDKEIKLGATALNAIGHWLIDLKRQKAVRESAQEMHPNVTNIVALLKNDMKVLRRNLIKEYDELIQTQKIFIKNNQGTLDALKKRSEIKAIADLLNEQQNADATFASMEKALEKLKETHEMLPSAFDRQSISLDKLLSDFIEEGKRIKKFYDTLDKKEN